MGGQRLTLLLSLFHFAGPADWVSVRRAGLLGRGRRVSGDLSRAHVYDEDSLQSCRGSNQQIRLCGLAISCDSVHRKPLFAGAASPDGIHISGTGTVFFVITVTPTE